MVALGCRAPDPAQQPAQQPVPAANASVTGYATVGATPCTPVGDIRFICNLVSAEDIAVLPGSEWLITSGNREGGRLHLVDVRNKTTTILFFPAPTRNEKLDAAAYPTCPGPLDLQKPDTFRAHGLYLQPGPNGLHALYVVHHGTRESVEVFAVDARTPPPTLTWIGCAPALSTMALNSVVALPEGGLAATSGRTGDVWEYYAATGSRRVPGSEGTAPNGLEISKDGQWLYVAGWAEEKLTRLSRGQMPVKKDIFNRAKMPSRQPADDG